MKKKIVSLITVWCLLTSTAFAQISGGPALLFDSNGVGITSTGTSLNVDMTNATIAVTQSGTWTTGRTWTLASGTDSVTAVQSGTWAMNLTQVGGSAVALGQTTMSASIPVTIASDQTRLPVSQSGTWNINNITGTVSLPTGASTSALQTTGNGFLSTIATNTTPLAQGSSTTGQSGQLSMGAVTTAAPTYTTGQTDPLSLTTAGALRVDGSGSTQPISGTVTANAGTGTFQTNVTNASIPVTQSGTWNVNTNPGDATQATYTAVVSGITLASSPTDIFTITGSSSKKIRIWGVQVFGAQTTGSTQTLTFVKRSTVDTGGTSATATAVPADSGDAAATSVVSSYTANPSALGTAVGTTYLTTPFVGAVQNTLASQSYIVGPIKPLVLNGASENIAVNMGGAAMAGAVYSFMITWSEE